MEAEELTKKCLHGQMEEILRKRSPIALEDILKPEKGRAVRCALIEGAPGVGKSTLAWEVCHRWEELETVKQYELVVLVQLREKRAQKARCLEDLLPKHRYTNMEALVAGIKKRNGKGMLVVCDGFDELPSEQREKDSVYIELIRGMLLPEATVIVTSRPSVSADLWSQCQNYIDKHLEILGFTKKKINEYAESVCSGDALQRFMSYITNNPPIYGMMYIPLNAVIVALTYKHSYDVETPFPTTMTQLYDALTRTLIRRHLVSTKQVRQNFSMPNSLQRTEDIDMLPSHVSRQLQELARVAYEGLLENRYVFTNLGEDFGHLGMMKKTTSLDPSVGPVCSFSFFHLTLQEYMAVLHCAFQPDCDCPLQVPSSLYDRETVQTFLKGLCRPDSNLVCRAATKAEEELQAELNLSRQLLQAQDQKITKLEEELQAKKMKVTEQQRELEVLKQKGKSKAKLMLLKVISIMIIIMIHLFL